MRVSSIRQPKRTPSPIYFFKYVEFSIFLCYTENYSIACKGRVAMEYKERKLRHELKFPATMPQCEILRQRFSAVMTPDKNGDKGKYRITSLYLDDAYNSAYIDKQNGTDTRKKYRIRTYDLNPQKIRFECKYKDNSMTSKRSMWITLPQYESILKGDFSFAWDKQYAGTVIDDGAISNSISLLSPSVVVDYTSYHRQRF